MAWPWQGWQRTWGSSSSSSNWWGGGSGGGGGPPPQRSNRWRPKGDSQLQQQPQKASSSNPVDEGHYVYSPWPVSVKAYPAPGQDNSWQSLVQMAAESGCVLKLAGKVSKNRPRRTSTITMKGIAAREVYRIVLRISIELGFDFHKARQHCRSPDIAAACLPSVTC